MYKALLILKYLRRKLAPMFAALAVMLCTMMVIIVISVMGGFLEKLTAAVQSLSGDVTVTAHSLTGFPHYQELIDQLEARPQIDAATPVIRTYGLVHMDGATFPLQIHGVRPAELDGIVAYREALHWSTDDYIEYLRQRAWGSTAQQQELIERIRERIGSLEQRGMSFEPPAVWQPDVEAGQPDADPSDADSPAAGLPGAVIGIEANPLHQRDAQGEYHIIASAMGKRVALTMMPLTEAGAFADNPVRRSLIVVNEFKSGVYEVDGNRIYVPFDWLQRQLDMQQVGPVWEEYDPRTLEPIGEPTVMPARATEVLVSGAAGVPLDQVRAAADAAAADVMQAHPDMPWITAATWREQYGTLLAAVQNEIGLVTFLFAIISLVAVVMVATTFYMIVLEKTRDIGVLRAVGASRWGIANLFLGYGLAIGTVGALLGLAAAVAIVTHLNEIQALLQTWFGWQMWNPQTYYFDRIPDQVEPVEAIIIVIAAILSSVVGALIPALLAARLDPVEALRYE